MLYVTMKDKSIYARKVWLYIYMVSSKVYKVIMYGNSISSDIKIL